MLYMSMNVHMFVYRSTREQNGSITGRRDAYFESLGTENFRTHMCLQQQSGTYPEQYERVWAHFARREMKQKCL